MPCMTSDQPPLACVCTKYHIRTVFQATVLCFKCKSFLQSYCKGHEIGVKYYCSYNCLHCYALTIRAYVILISFHHVLDKLVRFHSLNNSDTKGAHTRL